VQKWIERLHKLKLSLPRGGEPVHPEHGRFTPDQHLNIDQVYIKFSLFFSFLTQKILPHVCVCVYIMVACACVMAACACVMAAYVCVCYDGCMCMCDVAACVCVCDGVLTACACVTAACGCVMATYVCVLLCCVWCGCVCAYVMAACACVMAACVRDTHTHCTLGSLASHRLGYKSPPPMRLMSRKEQNTCGSLPLVTVTRSALPLTTA
jgi:hypothetical protein